MWLPNRQLERRQHHSGERALCSPLSRGRSKDKEAAAIAWNENDENKVMKHFVFGSLLCVKKIFYSWMSVLLHCKDGDVTATEEVCSQIEFFQSLLRSNMKEAHSHEVSLSLLYKEAVELVLTFVRLQRPAAFEKSLPNVKALFFSFVRFFLLPLHFRHSSNLIESSTRPSSCSRSNCASLLRRPCLLCYQRR